MYATPQDILDRYGDTGLFLAGRTEEGLPDTSPLMTALEEASSEIDTALRGRYRLPVESVPPVLRRIAVDLAVDAIPRNAPGKDPNGGKWPVSLGAREENRKTLIKTGRLRDSYTREVGHDSVEVGSNTKYAAIHHFGGVIRAKNAEALRFRIGESFVMKKAVTMPARPALGLNGEDEDHIMETTEDWIAGFVRGIK